MNEVGEVLRRRELCVGNIYLEHKSLHKYRRLARAKSMIDLVLVKKDMLRYM